MGFCKPGDPCWNSQLGTVNTARILEWQKQALQTAAECGIDISEFGNFCPDVLACMSGHTGHGTGYWIMNDSGDIYNTGTTASFVGIGTNAPAHQLHVEALPLADPLRVVSLNNQENYIVTVDADGIFYRSEYNSRIIDGGDF